MLPNLSALALGEPTGEFYALSPEDARDLRAVEYVDPHTLEPLPAEAERDDDDATFRLPFAEADADGSYRYRVYDAAALWRWVKEPGQAFDPVDRTPLLRSDWEALRDRYSTAAAHPTPPNAAFRRPITDYMDDDDDQALIPEGDEEFTVHNTPMEAWNALSEDEGVEGGAADVARVSESFERFMGWMTRVRDNGRTFNAAAQDLVNELRAMADAQGQGENFADVRDEDIYADMHDAMEMFTQRFPNYF